MPLIAVFPFPESKCKKLKVAVTVKNPYFDINVWREILKNA